MFKIAKTVKQLFNAASNIQQVASTSINNMIKYCTQSKGYIEDARDEFTFAKVLPNPILLQDKFSIVTPNPQNIVKAKSTQLLDSAEIRKLIYARFADEIAAKSKNVVDTKSQEIKEYIGDVVATYNITEEFKELREQGYNFKEHRDSIANHNVSGSENIEGKSSSDNSSINNSISKSLSQRMKELSISGYISSYSGEDGLRQDIEEVINKKSEVIEEFMERVGQKAAVTIEADILREEDLENSDSINDTATTTILGEY